jgi:hypothetical protein
MLTLVCIKDMCEKYELKFNELKASVMNEHRTTENDELFAQVPDEDKYGMIAFIKKKKFFPNVKMKYSIIPYLSSSGTCANNSSFSVVLCSFITEAFNSLNLSSYLSHISLISLTLMSHPSLGA